MSKPASVVATLSNGDRITCAPGDEAAALAEYRRIVAHLGPLELHGAAVTNSGPISRAEARAMLRAGASLAAVARALGGTITRKQFGGMAKRLGRNEQSARNAWCRRS